MAADIPVGIRRHPPARTKSPRRKAAERVGMRLAQMVLIAFLVVLVTFLLIHIVPGDPALNILGEHATPQAIAAIHQELHLNEPLPQQFAAFLSQLSHGDLGHSILPGNLSVAGIIFPALGVTARLVLITILIALALGIPLGIISGLRRGPVDVGIRGAMIILLAVPGFFIAFLLLILAEHTGIAPAGGWGKGFFGDLDYLWLPAVALAAYLTPVIARSLRQSVIETMQQDFMEAAIARGERGWRLVRRHVLPNSLLAVITLIGYNVGALLAGAVIIETIFNLPGLGSKLSYAVANRDYPVVQGAALVTALLVVIANALADIAYQLVDPRTRT